MKMHMEISSWGDFIFFKIPNRDERMEYPKMAFATCSFKVFSLGKSSAQPSNFHYSSYIDHVLRTTFSWMLSFNILQHS